MNKLLLISSLIFVTSCATLVRKEFKEDVTFDANGDSNVDLYVEGEYKGQTPQTIELDSREIYKVKYAKQGKKPVSYAMQGGVQAKYVVGDIVMGGVVLAIVPLIVDGVTNEWREFDEDDIRYRYKNFKWEDGAYTGPDGAEPARDAVQDTDGDGIMDKDDKCPQVKGVVANNGCPEMEVEINLDTDGDGIMDKNDKCPQVKGIAANNGCPEIKEEINMDSDGDGIMDKDDKCPKVAGTLALKGCPEMENKDTDGDGIIDKIDKCPEVAGVASNEGCPMEAPDTDGDGIVDKLDKCPEIAGLPALKGCPDSDGDGVIDSEDKCPNVIGLKNNNGCPKAEVIDDSHGADGKIIIKTGDHGQITNWQDIVSADLPEVSGKMFEISNLNFETGSSKIKGSSYTELNEVVDFLKKVPEAKLDVEGHTDSQGSEAGNKSLSQKRADAVVAYLVNKGVLKARLESHGFGEERPVADNETTDGRAKNRRVEFHIQ